jgi:ABC-2 type transport system permease protein
MKKSTKNNMNAARKRDWITIVLVFGILVMINIIASLSFKRFDLTSEKRYTLTKETYNLLDEIDDLILIKVYLEGEFPSEITKLKNATKEFLDEIRANAKGKIEYEFIDPAEASDIKTNKEFWDQLVKKGLKSTTITIAHKTGRQEKIIFPGAILTYRGKEIPLQILKSQHRAPSGQMIAESINNLEYEFALTIRQLLLEKRPKVAFIEGHGELSELETTDLMVSLQEFYDVARIKIDNKLNTLLNYETGKLDPVNPVRYDAIVIARPTKTFPEMEKFILDQYVMNGGKVLWMTNGAEADMDSLRGRETFLATRRSVNLEDQLFTYGVRINNDLILDRNCGKIDIITGTYGNQPKYERFDWFYHPVVSVTGKHPVASNVDPVLTEFPSTIDLVGGNHIKKTVLLASSDYSRILKAPARVSVNIINLDPNFKGSRVSNLPIAVLLEGEFESVFTNRLAPQLANNETIDFKEKAKAQNKMVVISDGNVARNPIDEAKGLYFPLGFDKYSRTIPYGNKEFLMNVINYLLGDSELIPSRSRGIRLRPLDKERAIYERTKWQTINIALPIIIITAIGFILAWYRKKRYI